MTHFGTKDEEDRKDLDESLKWAALLDFLEKKRIPDAYQGGSYMRCRTHDWSRKCTFFYGDQQLTLCETCVDMALPDQKEVVIPAESAGPDHCESCFSDLKSLTLCVWCEEWFCENCVDEKQTTACRKCAAELEDKIITNGAQSRLIH